MFGFESNLSVSAYAYSHTFDFVADIPNRSSIASTVDKTRHLISDDSIDSDREHNESDEQSINHPVIVSSFGMPLALSLLATKLHYPVLVVIRLLLLRLQKILFQYIHSSIQA